MTDTAELVGLPEGGPTSVPEAKAQLRIPADDTTDDPELDAVVEAVNALVRRWPVAQAAVGATAWPAHITRGATMLAARLFRRRNSPAGVEAFSQAGPVYVQRNDPDVAMLLKLGSWQAPGIG